MKTLITKWRFKFNKVLNYLELRIKTWHGQLSCFEIDLSEKTFIIDRVSQKNILIVAVETNFKEKTMMFWVFKEDEKEVYKLLNMF